MRNENNVKELQLPDQETHKKFTEAMFSHDKLINTYEENFKKDLSKNKKKEIIKLGEIRLVNAYQQENEFYESLKMILNLNIDKNLMLEKLEREIKRFHPNNGKCLPTFEKKKI